MKYTVLLMLITILIIPSCDVVKDPVPPSSTGPTNPIDTSTVDTSDTSAMIVRRKVLLEDFTGHRCNNCPDAARTATQLVSFYGEELVVVAVHCTFDFAAPASPPNANGSYSTDFRTPAGNAYENALGVNFLPNGAISRRMFNNSLLHGQSAWGSAVADIFGQEADLDIWFDQLTYNASANTVSAEVKVAVLNPIVGDQNLTIYLAEDHIIDWQLDNQASPNDVPDYEHRHVLRTTLNGTWGVPLVVGSAEPGDTLTFTYPNFQLNSAWVGSNCALVAYAYETDSYEVSQVKERKFQP